MEIPVLCPHCGGCVKTLARHCSALAFAEVMAEIEKFGRTCVWEAEHLACHKSIFMCVTIIAGGEGIGLAEIRVEKEAPEGYDEKEAWAARDPRAPSMN